METITREELREKIDRGDEFVLVDTLGAEYCQQSHLPGAINLPLEEVNQADEIVPHREADVSFPKHKLS